LLAVALLVYLLSKQGWDEIAGAFRQIAVWRILLAFALTFISRMAVSARWYVLLRSGKADISFGQSTRITFAGLFASNFLWTTIGGDVVRLAGAIRFKFDPAVSAASLVVDRLVGMAGMAMALPFALPRFFSFHCRPGSLCRPCHPLCQVTVGKSRSVHPAPAPGAGIMAKPATRTDLGPGLYLGAHAMRIWFRMAPTGRHG
jgi:hypothetical protein